MQSKMIALLEQGVRLMPLGTGKRADWILDVQRITHNVRDCEIHAINALERDAILAGLRLLQTAIALDPDFAQFDVGAIYTNSQRHSGLSDPAIESLCERLNIGD